MLLAFFIGVGNVWGTTAKQGTYYLFYGTSVNTAGNNLNTSDFIFAKDYVVNTSVSPAKTIGDGSFTHYVTPKSYGATSVASADPEKIMIYNAKTSVTKLTLYIKNDRNGAKDYYIDHVFEGEKTATADRAYKKSFTKASENGGTDDCEKKEYTFTNTNKKNVSIYVMPGQDVRIYQAIVEETGDDLLDIGEDGYVLGGYRSGVKTTGAITFEGLEILSTSNKAVLSGNIGVFTVSSSKPSGYMKFTTPNNGKYVLLTATHSSTKALQIEERASLPANTSGYSQLATAVTETKKKLSPNTTYMMFSINSGITMNTLTFSIPKVTYNANGGSETMAATEWTVAANGFTAPSGKMFKEWRTNADGTGTKYDEDDEIESDVTLFAIWEDAVTKYAVTKGTHANGDFTISPVEQKEGEKVTLAATPEDGYIFSSWSIVKTEGGSATGISVDANSQFVMPAYAVTVNATFKVDPCSAWGYGTTVTSVPSSGNSQVSGSLTVANVGCDVQTGAVCAGSSTSTKSIKANGSTKYVTASLGGTPIASIEFSLYTGSTDAASKKAYVVAYCSESTFNTSKLIQISEGNYGEVRNTNATSSSTQEIVKIDCPAGTKSVAIGRNISGVTTVADQGSSDARYVYYLRACPAASHAVTYALNGATGTTPTQADVAEGAKFTLHNGTTGITAPANKKFDGWYDGTTKYAGGAEYTMGGDDVELTAQWADAYAVTYVPNNGVLPTETMTDSNSPYLKDAEVTLLANAFTAPDGKEFDAWVVTKTAGGEAVAVTDGKFTMPAEAVTVTATWKDETVKYGVTYVLNGPTGDAPTETDKEASQEFTLAAAPTWADHVFQGWKWTDNESVDHIEAAEAEFTMPAYAVTFTAQWKLDPQATMSDAQYVIGGSALNMAAKFTSLNTEGSVSFSLKESYADASITAAGSFTATVAGEYIVVAEQAGDGTYANGSAEATVEVLESELSDTYVWKKSAYTGSCVASPNEDAPAAQYTNVEVDGMASVASGRPETAGNVTITFALNNAYSSLFGIKSVCAFGKIEETAGIEYSWNNTDWTPMAGGESSDSKHEFTAPAGSFPTNLYIRFTNVETGKKGVWFRNALVTLEAKKAIKNTVIDLTDVKINNSSISAANLATLKTADAYALDLADEYVTAPALKFNKHTVITYDDDSQVEKDDVISKTATVNLSGKWQASAEINAITYTVTMAKADAFIVHYYQADGETLIGSENVAVSGHPTAAGIMPTPQDYKRVVWKLNDVPVDLEDVTSDVAGTEISLVASYENAYATSINIEQWVLDNRKNNTAFRALLDAQNYKYGSLNDLDSLDEGKSNRNYAFLGQKIKTENAYISFLLQEGKTVKIRFGNVEKDFKIVIGATDYPQTTALNNATTASTNVYEHTAAADEIIKIVCMDASKALVVKQIMIGDAPEIADVTLPWLVTYDANGGSFVKTSEKYTGTPLVIGDATPADDDHLFDGWYDGDTKINAAAYEPTKNVTLVAKYVMKPSPFSLSALTYQIGEGAAQNVGYAEGTYTYTVELPYAGSYETITIAYTLAEGTSSTKAGAVLDVTSVPGAATFTVVASDATEKTYTVNFKKAAKDGVEIIGAVVTGDETADVTGLYKGTASVKLNDKKIDKGDYYIYVTLKEGYTFQDGDVLVVDVNAKSSGIGTEALEISTGEGNLDNGILISLAVDEYSIGENTIVLSSVPAGATSIGLKRSANLNAKIDGLKVYRPMNPVMTAITLGVDEVFEVEAVKGTGNTFSATLPYGTDLAALEATPTYYWNGAGTISAPTWDWGANAYTLTDKDGDATVYTITLVEAEVSRDATLSALSYGGTAIDLVPGVFNYTVNLPYGTEDVPELSATKNHPGAATPDIANAASFSNHQAVSTVTITAQDGTTTQVYTVTFKVALCPTVVIWDGSSMSAIASSPHAASGLAWTVASDQSGKMAVTNYSAAAGPIVCADNGKTYTTFNGGNSKHECKYIATGGNTKSGRSFKITVPKNYMVQLYVVFGTHSNDASTLFIDKVVGSSVSESTIAQATSSDRYNLTALTVMLAGSKEATVDYYINATSSLDIYEIDATVISLDYTRTVTVGRMGTVCVDHNVPAGYIFGAEVYKLLYWKYGTDWYDCQMVDFEQVEEMNAGEPYMIIPTSEMFGLHYGETVVDEPKAMSNGFTGTFDAIAAAPNNALTGNYGVVNNMIQKLGHNCNSPANRAYINLSETPSKEQYEAAQSSNPKVPRKRVSLGHKITEGEAVATSLDAINVESEEVQKVMINGEMYVIRAGHVYTATGMLVK